MALSDDVTPAATFAPLLSEGVVRRLDGATVYVDLDLGGSAKAVTSLTVAEGDWVLVAVGRRRTWILEVQA